MILLTTNEVNVDIDGFQTNLKQDDPNYFCVAKKQDYTIVPISCHIFEQERYTYQMKNPLTLRADINTTIDTDFFYSRVWLKYPLKVLPKQNKKSR